MALSVDLLQGSDHYGYKQGSPTFKDFVYATIRIVFPSPKTTVKRLSPLYLVTKRQWTITTSNFMGGKDIQMNLYTPYGLDTEAKGSTGFRMLKTLI